MCACLKAPWDSGCNVPGARCFPTSTRPCPRRSPQLPSPLPVTALQKSIFSGDSLILTLSSIPPFSPPSFLTMDEKTSSGGDSHVSHVQTSPDANGADVTTRRQSVALNVVDNPLKRESREDVYANAVAFAKTHDLSEDAELFGRAALVARDPTRLHEIPELSAPELTALEYERDHKWHGPTMLWYSISLCAIGAATQGWDQTGSNGANLSFPEEFGLSVNGVAVDSRSEWIIGLINAIIFLTAGLIGAFIVDPLNHYLGRRGEIFLTALCLTATPIGSGFAQSWQGLFAARFIMGIGIGAKNATVPIYSAEMAPARIRGALVMFWQLWVVIGIFLGFCANVIVKDVPRIAWRLQLGSAFIPSFILALGIWFCPESPRWLMKHGKFAKGFRSMCRLRAHPIIAARDYYYSLVIFEEEARLAQGSGYFTRLKECFSVPRIRRSNYGASTVMIAQQMCGINIISFYSATIFSNVGYTATQALYASLGFGAVQVVFTIPTLFLIDTKGRRTLTLITFPFMCVFLLAAGLSVLGVPQANADGVTAMLSAAERGRKLAPIVLFIYLFTIAYSLGEGPVAFQYSAEVFPTIQREQGMAWAVCINNTFAGILGLTFPRMVSVMTITGAFGFYAGLNLLAWFMIFCFVRETKQLTLEEIDQVFSVPTSQYLRHEGTVWLPYFIKHHIFRRDVPKPAQIIERREKVDSIELQFLPSTSHDSIRYMYIRDSKPHRLMDGSQLDESDRKLDIIVLGMKGSA
nr:polyol transporter 5 [Quercus suber]